MNREELESTVIHFMDGHTTMTLACSLNDEPWTSPVYYARHGLDLLFFSSTASRHSVVFRENPRAAASIYGQYTTWKDIKGLQMEGRVDALDSTLGLAKAMAIYVKRYPFVKDFLGGSTGFSLEMARKMSRLTLYVFRPGNIYYLDNSVGFGVRWKLEIRKGGSAGSPVRA